MIPTDRALADVSRRQGAIATACCATLGALIAGELLAPHYLTLGTLAVLPVVVACLLLRAPMAAGVVGIAVAGRLFPAATGDIAVALGVTESLAILGAAGLALWLGQGRTAPRRAPVLDATPAMGDAAVAAAVAPWTEPDDGLTRREREVVELAARGLSARRIAERLAISVRTVETHLARAYHKLGVTSKQELVARSLEADGGGAASRSQRPRPDR